MIQKLIYKMRKRRFCKLNRWFCPDCIYHDFVFDECEIFRGNRCRYPKYRERCAEALTIAIEALEADRPQGEWIYWRENGIKRCKCSRCLTSYGCLDTPYCPNCGTKMVGEGRDEC